MKKPSSPKNNPLKKSTDKAKDSGELRKPTKLTPLKEKNKKNWKSNLDEEEEDFTVEDDDVKLDGNFDDEEEDDAFYDDNF
ncbi:MAG TPA: hypothetical protein VGC65_08020 [Bacteroidia bacterium]|jgi:hypothetical protein